MTADEERAAVVAWLQSQAQRWRTQESWPMRSAIEMHAAAIERGDHHKEPTNG